MLNLVKRIMTDESGASAAEYGVLVALVLAAVVLGVGLFTTALGGIFTRLSGLLDSYIT